MDRRPLVRFSSLAALVLTGARCDDPSPARGPPPQPNVLVITIDTLRADHLGCYGYAPYAEPVSPCIDALAAEGLRFTACYSPRGQTGPSLSSMLTGLYPSNHGVLDNLEGLRDEASDLVDDFITIGYEAHGYAAMFPVKQSTQQALAFSRFAPDRASWFVARQQADDQRQWALDDAVEAAFLDQLLRRKPGARPFFSWLHFFDVHQPYSPPAAIHDAFAGDYRGPLRLDPAPTGARFNSVVKRHLDEKMRARAPLDPADARYVTALYDGGIKATDARIGRIVAALRRRGLLESTIVCITADHGEELGEHNGFWFHGNSVYDSVLHIPLIVRGPGVSGRTSYDLIQNIDLLPTLLELVGGKVPTGIDGLSHAEVFRGGLPALPIREIAWSEWEDVILGARTTEWKLIRNPRGARPKLQPYDGDDSGYWIGCRELYDLLSDPNEQHDVWRERNDEVEPLRREAEDEQERRFRKFVRGAVEVQNEADQAEMRALGYGTATGADGARTPNYRLDPASCDD